MNRSVFITRKLPEKIISKIKNSGLSVKQWNNESPVPRDILRKSVKEVDGVLCVLTDKIDKEILQDAEQLRVVSTMSVGYDHIDVPACFERGIRLGFTPDVLTDATAELTVSLLLATMRRLPEGIQAAKDGSWGPWTPFWMCGKSLSGSTVGIVGMGRIGKAVAQRLRAFNVSKFLYTARAAKSELDWAEFVNLDNLLTQSDIVIACCALNTETRHLFNAQTFGKMKEDAIFINTSRGDVVNQDDLLSALRDNRISAAGLDVTSPEPLPTDHPLFQEKNCVILPHIGSATYETRMKMADLAADNLIAGLSGEQMPSEIQK